MASSDPTLFRSQHIHQFETHDRANYGLFHPHYKLGEDGGTAVIPPLLKLTFDHDTRREHTRRVQDQQKRWQHLERNGRKPSISAVHKHPVTNCHPVQLPVLPSDPASPRRSALNLLNHQSLSSSSIFEEMAEHAPWSFSNRPEIGGDQKSRQQHHYTNHHHYSAGVGDNGERVGVDGSHAGVRASRVLGKVRGSGAFEERVMGKCRVETETLNAGTPGPGELGPWTQHINPKDLSRPDATPLQASTDPVKVRKPELNPIVDAERQAARVRLGIRAVPMHGGGTEGGGACKSKTGFSGPCARDTCAGMPIGIPYGTPPKEVTVGVGGWKRVPYWLDYPEEPNITDADLKKATLRADKGIYTLIDRGFVPPSTDLAPLLRPSKCLLTIPAPLHYHDEFDGSSMANTHGKHNLPAIFEAHPWTIVRNDRVPSSGPDYRLGRERKREERNWKAENW
ncbi:hypothetical protein HDU67_002889, partial [Dinochytrium kinnereticum]